MPPGDYRAKTPNLELFRNVFYGTGYSPVRGLPNFVRDRVKPHTREP